MRPPLCINMHDNNSCQVCLVANILHMYRVVDRPDLGELDRLLGRRCGQPLDGGVEVDFLLEMGFHVYQMVEEDLDGERFLLEGRSYLQEFFGKSWTANRARYWTDEKVVQRQRTVAKGMEVRERFRDRFTLRVGESPTVEDIREQVTQERVVDVMFGTGKKAVDHAVLVWMYTEGPRDSFFTTFYPAFRSGFPMYSLRTFAKKWNPFMGTTSYWLPEK